MANLKTLFILLTLSFIFTNCSTAQEKPSAELPSKTNETLDKVNPETKRFESKAGNFSINISQEPFQTRNLESEKGKEPGKQFFWQFEKTTYSVMYSAFNEDDLSRAFDEMNSGVRKTLQRNLGQSFSEKEISFEKYPAREFRFVTADGVKHIQRNYLVNDTGYLLTAGYVDEKSEKEAIEVLDSFKLLTEKK